MSGCRVRAGRRLSIRRWWARRASRFAADERGNVAILFALASVVLVGIAGAAGLLAVLFPHAFGTVDQFAVLALQGVKELPESGAVAAMDVTNITLKDAVVLIAIMRRKAEENTAMLHTKWTPRMVDKVLWALGHREGDRRS